MSERLDTPVTRQPALAERIAREAHEDQRCTVTGEPYIRHVERVVALVDSDEAKAVAWLHDVLEDCHEWDAPRLREAGVSDRVMAGVVWLTKPAGKPYDDYIHGIRRSRNALALTVKIADLRDHLRPNCPERLRARYERAWQTLTGTPWLQVQEPGCEFRTL